MTSTADLRLLPSVDQLVRLPRASEWVADYGRPLTIQAIRSSLDEARSRYPEEGAIPEKESLLNRAHELLLEWTAPTLRAVINATGVVLHTNLGRAPLSQAALQAVQEASSGYSTLEYDLEAGRRGSRSVHAEGLLQRITGAEGALV